MKFTSRSFVQSNIYRPTPNVYFNTDEKLILILTPWGNAESIDTIKKVILNYITSVQNDREATSPFQKISGLSPAANTLRTAVLLANDLLYKNKNKNEYTEGYEIFVGLQRDNEFSWISHGHPHLLLSRNSKTILPLSLDLDHALNLGGAEQLPPLPNSLIGTQPYLENQVKSMCPQSNDQLLLLSRSWINKELITHEGERKLESYVHSLTESDESAFWLGVLEF